MSTNWLNTLVESTKELESPARYVYWSGVAAISAILKKNVYFDRFGYKLYPNVYVILVSLQSGLRKGLPISLAKDLVEEVANTRVISGNNSIQGILKTLSMQQTLESGLILSDAQAFLVAPEMKAFLVGDDGLDTLTDLYNAHEHEKTWTKTLKGSPVEALKSPCITMLGGANEVMFDSLIMQKDLEGGFIGRTFIVHESERRTINSLMTKPEFTIPIKELAVKLKAISLLRGTFEMNDNVRRVYTKWYEKVAKVAYKDKTGTLERIGDQCLRLAMIVSVAERIELCISLDSMQEAIDRCEEFFAGTKRISMANGKAQTALGSRLVIKCLLKAKGNTIERSKLLDELFPDVDAKELDSVMDTLGEINGRGVLSWERIQSKLYYKMNEKYVSSFKKFEDEL